MQSDLASAGGSPQTNVSVSSEFRTPSPIHPVAFRRRVDSLLRWFRSCAHCGSVFPPIDLLCANCSRRLRKQINTTENIVRAGYPFPVHSLLSWSEDDALISSVIYAFKGGWAVRSARDFAEALSFERRQLGERLCFAYPQTPAQGQKDHAWLLAHQFAEIWSAPAPIPLSLAEPERGSRQRGRSANDRSLRRFEMANGEENFSNSDRRWVFVDDVITTGSTAMAAYMALGDPSRFEVWALACRPKLAGKSSF